VQDYVIEQDRKRRKPFRRNVTVPKTESKTWKSRNQLKEMSLG